MKAEHKRKLIVDNYAMSKMLGIDTPQLFFDKEAYVEHTELFGVTHCHRISRRNLGQCAVKAHAVFINPYVGKTAYREYLATLAHELVHYRWRYLEHGRIFEAKVRFVLREFRALKKGDTPK